MAIAAQLPFARIEAKPTPVSNNDSMQLPMIISKPILATDLDGTLIPSAAAPEGSRERRALRKLARCNEADEIELVFVTGRHFESVMAVMRSEQLPTPSWIVCDVGSSIYERAQESFRPVPDYEKHIEGLVRELDVQSLRPLLQDKCQVEPQEEEKQQKFKLSFYCDGPLMQSSVCQIEVILNDSSLPFCVIGSIDPFNRRGLIDVMPQKVNKAYALDWWAARQKLNRDEIIFAGDSGNDFAALTHGFRAILVGNASFELAQSVKQYHEKAGTSERFFYATQHTSAGILEGCEHFGVIRKDFSMETP